MKKTFSFLSRFQVLLVFAILLVSLAGGANYQTVLGSNLLEEDNPYPDAVNEYRNLRLVDENGEIPADAYLHAQEQLDEMIAQQDLNAASAGIERGSWNWIGPGNIGGRVRALVVHPTNPDIIWAGAISGGVWKTTNGGVSWQIQDDFMKNMAVTSLIVDPTAPDTLYAGTGEGFGGTGPDDGIRGAWIFKTTDGGATWAQLPIATSDPWENVYYVNRLAISPDGNTLLAVTEDGIFRSINAGDSWSLSIMPDGWAWTWQNRPLDVDFDPLDSLHAVASGAGGDLWRSTDGGVE